MKFDLLFNFKIIVVSIILINYTLQNYLKIFKNHKNQTYDEINLFLLFFPGIGIFLLTRSS